MNKQGLYRMFAFVLLLFIVASACGGTAPATPPPNPTDPQSITVVPEKNLTGSYDNSMDQVGDRVTNGTIDAWDPARTWGPFWIGLFWGVIALIVIGFIVGGLFQNSGAGVIAGVIALLVVFFIARGVYAGKMYTNLAAAVEKQATHAMKEGIDGAKLDKATTYVEELHVNVVKAEREWKDCLGYTSFRNRYGDGGPSECVQYGVPEWTRDWDRHTEWDTCSRTEGSGDDAHTVYYDCNPHDIWNTDHTPYLSKVVRSYASVWLIDDLADPETGLVVSGEENLPRHYFDSNWVVPTDYTSYWVDPNNTYGVINAPSHPQWDRYRQMLAEGINPQVNVYHIYTNWLLASDSELLTESSADVKMYADLGLMPTMNTIYNANGVDEWAVDYDMIQFMGFDLTPEAKTEWNVRFAREYSKFLSPKRQISLSIDFAPASKVGNIDDYATAVKANYLDNSGKWDVNMFGLGYPVHRLLPKNAALIVCTTDDALTLIQECRFTTAMPKGNEQLMYDFALPSTVEMQNIPFSPEGFFGVFSLVLTDGSLGYRDVDSLSYTGTPRPMSLLVRDPEQGGIKREKMGSYAYRQANVPLVQSDIDNLVVKEVAVQIEAAEKALWHAFWFFGWLMIAIVVVVILAGVGLANS